MSTAEWLNVSNNYLVVFVDDNDNALATFEACDADIAMLEKNKSAFPKYKVFDK